MLTRCGSEGRGTLGARIGDEILLHGSSNAGVKAGGALCCIALPTQRKKNFEKYLASSRSCTESPPFLLYARRDGRQLQAQVEIVLIFLGFLQDRYHYPFLSQHNSHLASQLYEAAILHIVTPCTYLALYHRPRASRPHFLH